MTDEGRVNGIIATMMRLAGNDLLRRVRRYAFASDRDVLRTSSV